MQITIGKHGHVEIIAVRPKQTMRIVTPAGRSHCRNGSAPVAASRDTLGQSRLQIFLTIYSYFYYKRLFNVLLSLCEFSLWLLAGRKMTFYLFTKNSFCSSERQLCPFLSEKTEL